MNDYYAEVVAGMRRRMAHALYALVVATTVHPPMPRTAAEVCVYDEEAGSPLATGAGLREAARRGYCVRTSGGYWVAANKTMDLRRALEDRYLADTAPGDC